MAILFINNLMEGFREFVENPIYTDQEVVNLYLNSPDTKIQEIAYKTGKSIGKIYRILQNNFVKPNRLNSGQDNVINFAYSGLSVPQIAELTGYSPRNVRYILAKNK